MEKKGLSYIDWSISFGIFVISVIILFILARPYLTQEYSNEYLLSIAKQGLEDYAYVQVSVFPLFVGSEQIASPFQVNNAVLPYYSDLFEDDNRIAIVDEEFNPILKYELADPVPNKNIKFEGESIGSGVNVFYVLYHSLEDFVYPSEELGGNVVPATGFRSCSQNNVLCTFGIEEKRKGFFMDKFDELFNRREEDPYTQFKEILKYPKTKNLMINIFDIDGNTLYSSSFDIEPAESDNVYVLTWSDYSLTEYGQKEVIDITIKVW